MMFVTVCCFVLLGILYYFWRHTKLHNQPPCPGYYPIVGSIFHLKKPVSSFLRNQYPNEDVVLMYFGGTRVYYLNSYKAVKEAYLSQPDAFVLRPVDVISHNRYGIEGGLVMMSGDVWSEYRTFTVKAMKQFGVGTSVVESIITNEVTHFSEHINNHINEPIETAGLYAKYVANVISQFLFGNRVGSEDSEFERLLDVFATLVETKDHTQDVFFVNFLLSLCCGNTWLAYTLLNNIPDVRLVFDNYEYLVTFCAKKIDEQNLDLGEAEEATNFIERHTQHLKKLQRQNVKTIMNKQRLAMAMADLFVAGTDTTSATLRWAFIYMHSHPDKFETAAKEILSVVGSGRPVAMSDRTSLPYTLSLIEELHRCACLVQLSLHHRAARDVTVCGYYIPKDSLTFTNVVNIHNNEQEFPEPEEFRPERYLDENGSFKPHPHVIPFGVGKRSCAGESLATMEIFLFLSNLLQRYHVRLTPESAAKFDDLKSHPTDGDNRAPHNFTVLFDHRSH